MTKDAIDFGAGIFAILLSGFAIGYATAIQNIQAKLILIAFPIIIGIPMGVLVLYES